MRISVKQTVLLLWAFLLPLSCSRMEQERAAAEEPVASEEAQAAPRVAVVQFDDATVSMVEDCVTRGSLQTKSAPIDGLFAELGVVGLERVFPDAGVFEERTRREGLHRWYRVSYSEPVPATKAGGMLAGLPGVENAYAPHAIRINDVTDPGFGRQWDLYNTGSGVDINVKPVWAQFTTGNPKVIVSIVDTGVDIEHEDLKDNFGAPTENRNTMNGSYKLQPGSHGTHVAGTVAAVSHNGIGVCGIAGGDYAAGQKGVTLMSCQILSPEGSGGGNSPAAIKWAADHGAVISQNSWGYYYDYNDDGRLTGEELEDALAATVDMADKAAIDYFVKYAGCDNDGNQLPDSPMKGGVVIFAAGNDGIANGAPANYEKVVAVASVGENGSKASYSNYGDWVDICAPGTGIYSTYPNNGYELSSGTSMACPHVSGVAALLVSYYGGYGFTADQLIDKLLSGAKVSHKAAGSKIGPLLDAMGSFTYGSVLPPEPVTDYQASVSGNTITLSFTVPADEDDGKAYGYNVVLADSAQEVSAYDPTVPAPSGVKVVELLTGTVPAGETFTGYLEDLSFEHSYYLGIVAKDYSNNYAALSPVKNVKTLANNPPVITRETTEDIVMRASATYTLNLQVTDPDRHSFKVAIQDQTNVAEMSAVDEEGRFYILFTAKRASAGNYKVKVIATDSYWGQGLLEIPYTVLENQAPEKIRDFENQVTRTIGSQYVFDMDNYVQDPDGDEVTFSIRNSDNKVVDAILEQNRLTCTVIGYGLSRITIVARDNAGKAQEFSFGILAKDPANPCEAFPNPVFDKLNIRTEADAETYVRLANSAGSVLFEETGVIGGFSGYFVDMTPYAPGKYYLTVRYSGNEYVKTIMKL